MNKRKWFTLILINAIGFAILTSAVVYHSTFLNKIDDKLMSLLGEIIPTSLSSFFMMVSEIISPLTTSVATIFVSVFLFTKDKVLGAWFFLLFFQGVQ